MSLKTMSSLRARGAQRSRILCSSGDITWMENRDHENTRYQNGEHNNRDHNKNQFNLQLLNILPNFKVTSIIELQNIIDKFYCIEFINNWCISLIFNGLLVFVFYLFKAIFVEGPVCAVHLSLSWIAICLKQFSSEVQ